MHDPCPVGFREACPTSKDTISHHWRAGASWSGELVKLTTEHGYNMISSAGWYLPGNASDFYKVAALWQADPSQVMSNAFGHAPVVAGVLWQGHGGRVEPWVGGAEQRLLQFRCHLAERGIAATPVGEKQSFGSCLR